MRFLPVSLATLLLSSSIPALAQPAPPPTQPAPPPTYIAPPYAPGPMPMLPPPMEAPKRRSTSMMVAGIVLTSIASLSLVSGIGASVASVNSRGDGATILFAVVGLPLIGASTIFAGIGIPLWVVGARAPKPRYAEAIPRLSVGGGSGALRWTF